MRRHFLAFCFVVESRDHEATREGRGMGEEARPSDNFCEEC